MCKMTEARNYPLFHARTVFPLPYFPLPRSNFSPRTGTISNGSQQWIRTSQAPPACTAPGELTVTLLKDSSSLFILHQVRLFFGDVTSKCSLKTGKALPLSSCENTKFSRKSHPNRKKAKDWHTNSVFNKPKWQLNPDANKYESEK